MLLGQRNRLAIELRPLAPTWERRYLPERSAWAQLSIWVNGENLCRNIQEGSESIREGINVPLACLTDWLVRSWVYIQFEERPRYFPPRGSIRDTLRDWGNTSWPPAFGEDEWFDAREQWWMRHFLTAGADGAQLPNVSLLRSGDHLFIEWGPASFAGARAPRFIAEEGQEIVRWDEGEAALAAFVAYMAEWLRREGLDGVFSWASRTDPLHELEAGFHDKLQAYTGVDAGDLCAWTAASDEADLRRGLGIPEGSEDPGESVITQVLRDLPPLAPESVRRQVWRLDEATRRATNFEDELRAVARDAAGAGADPETEGQLAAQGVRDHLDLNGRPIEDMEGQMRALGVEVVDSDAEYSQERMLVGSRRGIGSVAIVNRTPRTETPWGRRFELARAWAHLLVDSYRADALGAASTAFAQPWARRRSGAFAAELLLPHECLRERVGGGLDSAADPAVFRSILSRYRVGARTAAFQLWNHGLLSSSQIRDELIDSFSGAES